MYFNSEEIIFFNILSEEPFDNTLQVNLISKIASRWHFSAKFNDQVPNYLTRWYILIRLWYKYSIILDQILASFEMFDGNMFSEIDFMLDGLVTDSTLVILSRLMNCLIMDFERLGT